MKERIGNVLFASGITLVLYFMYWVDMWMHLVVGGGYLTMYSSIDFWGTKTVMEAVYLNHLTLFMLGVALTIAGALFSVRVPPEKAVWVGLACVVFLNSLWGLVWHVLELGLPSSLFHLYVEIWAGRYYAWGFHPWLPVLYWHRAAVILFSALGTLYGFYALVFPERLNFTIGLGAPTLWFAASVLAGNLVCSPTYVLLGSALLVAGTFLATLGRKNLFKLGMVASLSCCLIAAGVGFGEVQYVSLNSPYGCFAVEHLPAGVYVLNIDESTIFTAPLDVSQGVQLPLNIIDLSFGKESVILFNMKTGIAVTLTDTETFIPEGDYFIFSQHPFALVRVKA